MPFGTYTIVILILITIPEIPAIIKWVKRKRSVYATGIKERECAKLEAERGKEQRINKLARRMSLNPFFAKPKYDPDKRTLSVGVRPPKTWKNRLMRFAVWAANHRILPERLLLWIGPKLGYERSEKYDGFS